MFDDKTTAELFDDNRPLPLKIKFSNELARHVYKNGELLSPATDGSSCVDLRATTVTTTDGKEFLLADQLVEADLELNGAKSPFKIGLPTTIETVKTFTLKPMERVLVGSGLMFEQPNPHKSSIKYEIQVRPRSGLAWKSGITVVNSPGTIDSDYRGEVKTIIANISNKDFEITLGDRISQFSLSKVCAIKSVIVETLDKTIRSEGGFGSTGKK